MSRTTILVRGSGFVNKGAEAMTLVLGHQLSRRIEGLQPLRTEVQPNESQRAAEAGFVPAPIEYPAGGKVAKMGRLVAASLGHPGLWSDAICRPQQLLTIRERLGRARAVLDIAGFAYSDDWGPKPALQSLSYAKHCRRIGGGYYLLPQAWGPFEKQPVADAVRRLLDASEAFYARDRVSRDHLAELLGVPAEEVPVLCDIAFSFENPDPERGVKLLKQAGAQGEGPFVGLSPNMRVYEKTPGEGAENLYVKVLVNFIHAMGEMACTPVLLPHEIGVSNQQQDDRYLCRLVREASGMGESICLVDGVYSAGQIKSMIASCQMLIGSRFHALVAALSSQVPVLALGWSHKYEELLALFGLEKLTINHTQLQEVEMADKLRQVWEDRTEISESIRQKLPLLQQPIDRFFDQLAARLVGERSL